MQLLQADDFVQHGEEQVEVKVYVRTVYYCYYEAAQTSNSGVQGFQVVVVLVKDSVR